MMKICYIFLQDGIVFDGLTDAYDHCHMVCTLTVNGLNFRGKNFHDYNYFTEVLNSWFEMNSLMISGTAVLGYL